MIEWFNKQIKTFNFWDMFGIKVSTLATSLLIAKFWPDILALDWTWYLALTVVPALWPLSKVTGFRK